jgi:hypothetical protein
MYWLRQFKPRLAIHPKPTAVVDIARADDRLVVLSSQLRQQLKAMCR